MAGDIFISYRRTDQAKAQRLHSLLKERGVEAWYDQHIGAGEDWRGSIAAALEAAPIFVLLFSKEAAESEQIAKELAAATYSKKTIIPVRLADVSPAGAFLYELAARHWFDLFPNPDVRMVELADNLAALVKQGPDAKDAARTLGATLTRSSKSTRLPVLAGLGSLALALVATVAFFMWPHAAVTPRLAVMRFENMGATEPFFAEGVADELIGELSQVVGLDVTARASSFALTGEQATPANAAKELGATLVLTGSVRHAGGTVRVDAQLAQAPDGKVVWGDTFERPEGDALKLQRDIAVRVAQAADVRITAPPATHVDPVAYRFYLQGREEQLGRVGSDWQKTRDLYRQAVDADPRFARAWAALARAEANVASEKVDYDPQGAAWFTDASLAPTFAAVDQAIALDGSLAEPFLVRSMADTWAGHWQAAADAAAMAEKRGGQAGNFYRALGYIQKSIDARRRSSALDPLSAVEWTNFAYTCEYAGNVSCQLEAAQRAHEVAPDNVVALRGLIRALIAANRKDEAWKLLVDAGWMKPENLSLATRILAYQAGHGSPVPVTEILTNVDQHKADIDIAVIQLADLRQWKQAAALLDRWGPRSLSQTFDLFRIQMAPVRNSPQFWALMKREGLTDYWKKSGRWPDFCNTEPVCKPFD